MKKEPQKNTREKFNTERLLDYTKRMIQVAYFLVMIFCLLFIYLFYKYFEVTKKELTYIITEESTIALQKVAMSKKKRAKWEYANFVKQLACLLVTHQPNTFEKDLEKAKCLLSARAFLAIKNQFITNELDTLYLEHKGYSDLEVIETKVDWRKRRAVVVYNLRVSFPSLNIKEQTVRQALEAEIDLVPRSAENPYGMIATRVSIIDAKKRKKEKS